MLADKRAPKLTADHMRAEGEQPEIEAAADQLFEVGFARLAEAGGGYASTC